MKHLAKLMLLTLGIGVVVVVVSFPRHTATAAPPPKITLTRDVDNPANEPFGLSLCFATVSGGCNGVPGQFTVPTVRGATSAPVQRLVIEYYSAQCIQNASTLNLEVTSAGSDNFYYIGPWLLDSTAKYYSSQQTRIYADPGTAVYLNAAAIGSGNSTCNVTVSGYLVLQ